MDRQRYFAFAPGRQALGRAGNALPDRVELSALRASSRAVVRRPDGVDQVVGPTVWLNDTAYGNPWVGAVII